MTWNIKINTWPNICTALLTQYTQYFDSISVYTPLLGYTMQDFKNKTWKNVDRSVHRRVSNKYWDVNERQIIFGSFRIVPWITRVMLVKSKDDFVTSCKLTFSLCQTAPTWTSSLVLPSVPHVTTTTAAIARKWGEKYERSGNHCHVWLFWELQLCKRRVSGSCKRYHAALQCFVEY